MKIKLFHMFLIFLIIFICCPLLIYAETFQNENKPSMEKNSMYNYELQKPWNYDLPENSKRSYPLIVALHGATGRTDVYYTPIIVNNEKQMKEYPCFYMAPNNPPGWGDEASWVRTQIEELKKQYRIDENRIYLIGFSMGGSGSYLFAEAYYKEYGQLFAAIVRLAGNTGYELSPPLAAKTSIWYHIGWRDDKQRVITARSAFDFIKDLLEYEDSYESLKFGLAGRQPYRTRTITFKNTEIMKLSDYPLMGHDSDTPFKNEAVLEWLFSQSLTSR